MHSRWAWLSWFVAAWLLGCADPLEPPTTASEPLIDSSPNHRTDVVALKATRGADEMLCTGSLLLPNLVMTARHCATLDPSALETGNCDTAVLSPLDAATVITVYPGSDMALTPESQRVRVREVWLRGYDGRLCGQDAALLLLNTPITGSTVDATFELPKPKAKFAAVGYGLFEGNSDNQRQNNRATLDCIGNACDDDRLVAGEFLATSGACEGDAGGPALDSKSRVFGIASRTASDCSETAYVTVASNWNWLTNAVRQAALESGREVPTWTTLEATAPDPESGSIDPTLGWQLTGGGGCSLARHANGAAWCGAMLALGLVGMRRRRRARKTGCC